MNHKRNECIHCNSGPTDEFLTFEKTKYGQNIIVNQMKQNDEQNIVCDKCHNGIFRVPCYMSHMWENYEKMCTFKFDMNKYSSLQNQILEMPKSQRTNSYICKSCHFQLQPKFTCVCCNTNRHKHVIKMYNKVDYDFINFVVSWCLGHVSNSAHEEQYICASCDKRLKETSNENPVVPYFGKFQMQ